MSEKAAIRATYSDYRRVKGRKVLQLIFEVPLEQAPEVHDVFGEPSPDGSTWVAIARLQSQPAAQQAEKPKKSWDEMPRSAQAAMKCNDADFQRFLSAEYRRGIGDAIQAASVVRQVCSIKSRADLDHNEPAAHAWDRLYSNYQMWKRGAAA